MTISEIKIRKTFSEGNLKAIVSATLDNCLAIHDIKIVQGSDRLFAAMPSRKDERVRLCMKHLSLEITNLQI